MYHYSKRIKVKAMAKTNYSTVRSKLTGDIGNSKNNLKKLKINQENLKKSTNELIVVADKYYTIGKEFETIISGLNRTNLQLRIKLVIDRIINRHVPSNIRSKFASLKKNLEQFSKMTGLDISKVKNKIVADAKIKIDNEILDEAERMYNKLYMNAGFNKIKHAYSKNEIAKWLRKNKSSEHIKSFVNKLNVAKTIVEKLEKVIKVTDSAVSIFDCYSKGKDLLNEQSQLKTAQDYNEYYYKIAQKASAMASELKKLSGKLPPGMRDYYEFIFTVAENTDKMAKVVYKYVEDLEKAMKECDRDIQRNQKSRSVKAGDSEPINNFSDGTKKNQNG